MSVGKDVTTRAVGDNVAAFSMQGSHSEIWAVTASRTWLVPAGLDIAKAAALPISFGSAYHSVVSRGAIGMGETILIHAAAGGVGLAAVQLAKRAGATVIAVTSGSERQAPLIELGATFVIDRLQYDVVEEARRLTNGKGVDLAIDPVGSTCKLRFPRSHRKGVSSSLAMLAAESSMSIYGCRCRIIRRCTGYLWDPSSNGLRCTAASTISLLPPQPERSTSRSTDLSRSKTLRTRTNTPKRPGPSGGS